MQVTINRGQSSLAEQKAVASSVIDQKINLLVNGLCVAIQAVYKMARLFTSGTLPPLLYSVAQSLTALRTFVTASVAPGD